MSGRNTCAAFVMAAGLAAQPAAAAPARSLNLAAGYQGSLLINLLDLRLRTRVSDQHFSTDAHLESSGAVSFIRRFDINAASVGGFVGGRAIPAAYVQHSLEGHKASRRTLIVPPNSPVVDPLSQGLRLTTAAMERAPCPGVMPTSDGKQRYDLVLNYIGPGALSAGQQAMGLGQPVTCRLDIRPISGFRSNNQQGLRQFVHGDIRATFAKAAASGVWVASDVSADTLVGALHLRLTSLAVQGGRAAFETPPRRRSRLGAGRAIARARSAKSGTWFRDQNALKLLNLERMRRLRRRRSGRWSWRPSWSAGRWPCAPLRPGSWRRR